MSMELTANEARVLGCLMEKSVVTPDQYPLTLNALTNACNQKSSRDPVMSLEPGAVQATIRSLQEKRLVRVEENFRTQVEKYTQRLCNTPFSDFQFDAPEFSIICVLLLRGPRTPGELRANSGRLHTFADNAEVVEALDRLQTRDGGPVVVELPRVAGRRDSEYMHLLSGPIQGGRAPQREPADRRVAPTGAHRDAPAIAAGEIEDIETRLARLEAELAELRRILAQRD